MVRSLSLLLLLLLLLTYLLGGYIDRQGHICVHVSVRVGVGGREINEFGVLLYVNTPEQNKTEEEKERKEEGSRPVVVTTVVVVPCLQ